MKNRTRLAILLLTGLLSGWLSCDTVQAAHENLTGIWTGEYSYPKGSDREPVRFRLFISDGERLSGGVLESNTFGEGEERWLHAAIVDATVDRESGELRFTKRYDGTDGVDHDVMYVGRLADDGESVQGVWDIPDSWNGQFRIQREVDADGGALTGAWSGTYVYPPGSVDADGVALRPVKFWVVLIDASGTVQGYMIEPNTFGDPDAPWLHALVKGRFDADRSEVVFTKNYDSTGDVGHDVQYTGRLSATGELVEGTWDIDGFGGTFQLEQGGRHPLDADMPPTLP